jgi:hypothetical protein
MESKTKVTKEKKQQNVGSLYGILEVIFPATFSTNLINLVVKFVSFLLET